jgi:hypothetical protein
VATHVARFAETSCSAKTSANGSHGTLMLCPVDSTHGLPAVGSAVPFTHGGFRMSRDDLPPQGAARRRSHVGLRAAHAATERKIAGVAVRIGVLASVLGVTIWVGVDMTSPPTWKAGAGLPVAVHSLACPANGCTAACCHQPVHVASAEERKVSSSRASAAGRVTVAAR